MVRRLIPALALATLMALPAARAFTVTRPAPRALRTVTLGMGYIPSVQFAPFYIAQQRGYYRQAGLNVDFSYAFSPNLLELVGAGKLDFANADGTDAILAEAHGVPVSYVMAEYERFPVAIFALNTSHIRSVANLHGKTIGVPGLYGATYVGLLAALRAAGLKPSDVRIQAIGYTQVASVAAGKVDAAVGYSINEPVILARHGYRVTTLEVSKVADLVAPGLMAGRGLVKSDPSLVRAIVQATLHGVADAIANPKMAFDISLRIHGLSTLRGDAATDQYAVLQRAVAFWHGPTTLRYGLGYADPAQWTNSVRILRAIGQLTQAPAPATMFTNAFASGAPRV